MGDPPKKSGASHDPAAVVNSLAELAAYKGPRQTVTVEASPKIVSRPKGNAPQAGWVDEDEPDIDALDFDGDDDDEGF